MNLLMINPVIRPNEKPMCIPHGLATIASVIRKNCSDVDITFLDINGYRYDNNTVEKMIQQMDFDVVFIGGLIPVYKQVIDMSEFVKQVNPDAIFVAGGSVAMSVPNELLTNSKVDVICMGEGEVTAIELLEHFKENGLNRLSKVRGISYLKNGKFVQTSPMPFIQDLDTESALPAYDLLPMEIYLNINVTGGCGREIDFVTTRGCPYLCSFCYQPWGHKQRIHSIGFMRNAIKFLIDEYEVDFIAFMDDEFMADRKRLKEFCDLRNKEFPNLHWSATGRANMTAKNEDLVSLVRKSGCTEIAYGFESASPRMLKSMHKSQTPEMMEKTVNISRKYGLPVSASFIIGLPGEDEESCKETTDFCLKNNISLASLMFATPYPGTEIYDFAIRTGRIKDVHQFALSLRDARDFVVNLTDAFTDQQLIDKRKEMMELTRENYNKYITRDQVMQKIKDLFGSLYKEFDDKELESRMKYGGVGMF